jgi:dihydrofolate reductase
MREQRLEAIVAVARNGVIGRDSTLPWRLKSDLQRFKQITMGHSLLMGRKTYESIGRPLPGRETWVLSRQHGLVIPGCQVAPSVSEVLERLPAKARIFVVGGAEIYQQTAGLCGVMHLTHVLAEVDGDTTLPPFDLSGFRCIEELYTPADTENDWPTQYERWVMKDA